MSTLKETLRLVRHAPGWRVEPTGGGHWRCVPPVATVPAIIVSSTPSDWRAVHKIRSQLHRAGLSLGGH